jgi:hypothetical protein
MKSIGARLTRMLAVAALLAGAAGCDNIKATLGLEKGGPDEFAVVTKAPLTLPPDYALRPPAPGAPPLQETQPRQAAESALIGTSPQAAGAETRSDGRSAGETAFLRQAHAADVNPNIRQVVNSEFTQLADRDRSFTDRLLFWQKAPEPGPVIDPQKEAVRLRQDAANGQPPTTGDTPIIERKQRGWLEGIF